MVALDQTHVLAPDDPALDAMLALSEAGEDSAFVLENGRLVGIVYARDVADALASGRRRPQRRSSRSGSTVVPFPPRAVTASPDRTSPPRDAA